jgi:hypothetical protein
MSMKGADQRTQAQPRGDRRSQTDEAGKKPRQQIDSTFSTAADRAFESLGKGLRTRHPDADDTEHLRRNREEPK